MKNYFRKPFRWAIVFTILLTGTFSFVMLDTFVIPKSYQTVVTKASENTNTNTQEATDATDNAVAASATQGSESTVDTTEDMTDTTTDTTTVSQKDAATSQVTDDGAANDSAVASASASDPVITDTTYEDENIKISIDTLRVSDSNVYVVDIQLSDASYLKTALANDTYGRNIKAATSDIAANHNAIFAINGDYYGFRDYGYVLRNGVLYRDTAGDGDALVVDNNGDFSIVNEALTSLDSLDLSTIWQILTFGPALIDDGQIVVDSNSEVSQSMSSNPRTAIGQVSALHYIVVVSDGRTNESAGLSLLDLAQVMADYGCTTAYNLDGGGSSTMYFNGQVVNVPTDGRSYGERKVSDIVYIGY